MKEKFIITLLVILGSGMIAASFGLDTEFARRSLFILGIITVFIPFPPSNINEITRTHWSHLLQQIISVILIVLGVSYILTSSFPTRNKIAIGVIILLMIGLRIMSYNKRK